MKHKFKDVLVKQAQKEIDFDNKQNKLKDKYGIDKDVVVVEKTNMLKFLIKHIGIVFRAIAKILILSLAVIGLISLIYPVPRKEVLEIVLLSFKEIIKLIGV